MDFRYKIGDKFYPVKRILFNDLKDIQLLIALKDDQQLLEWFNSLIYNADINILDKMVMLLYSFLLTVSEKAPFAISEKDEEDQSEQQNIPFNPFEDPDKIIYIEPIINNLKSIKIENKKIYLEENSYIEVSLPHEFFSLKEETMYEDMNEYLYKFVRKIVIDGEEAPIAMEIINELPAKIISEIEQYANEVCEKMNNTLLLGEKYEKINCHPAMLFEYLKKIFTFDIEYLINNEYVVFKHIRATNYMTLTLKEIELLIKAFNDDMKRQEEEFNKQNNQNQTMTIPNQTLFDV